MLIDSMNRSSWASGSGYVPSCSIGFWVAMTKKGDSRSKVFEPAVTWYSCMACRRAACVLGGVRLISSARTMLAKIGPGTKRKLPLAGGDVFLDDLGAGDVAGHEVGRELDAAELQVQRPGQRGDRQRLGQAGHADGQAVAAGEQADQHLLDHLLLADDHLVDLAPEVLAGTLHPVDGLFGAHLRRGRLPLR